MESFFIVIKDILTAMYLKGLRFSRQDAESSIICTLFHWMSLLEEIDASGANWMKVVKYKLAAFAAYWKCNSDLPKPPFKRNDSPKLLVNGIIGKVFNSTFWYVRNAIKNNYLAWTSQEPSIKVFYYSVFDTVCRGIKKGCPRATIDLLEDDIRATVKKFTTFVASEPTSFLSNCSRFCLDCSNSTCLLNHSVTPDDLEREIKRTIDEICGDSKFNPIDHFNLNIPSISSATDCPRHVMGGLNKFLFPESITNFPSHNVMVDGETVNCTLSEPIEVHSPDNDLYEFNDEGILTLLEKAFKPLEDFHEKDTLAVGIKYYGDLKESSRIFFDRIVELALKEQPHMKAVALAEALKIRGITTPPAFGTFVGKPLQKFIAKLLLKFNCFAATGGPITEEILKKAFPYIPQTDKFLSGDYDDATNKLKTRFTRIAIRYYCEKLGIDERLAVIYERNLCDGLMYCPDTKEYLEQQNAQPMGNILSFVLLCTINAAATRYAWEIDHDNVTNLHDYPALINGDDFLSTFQNFKVWEEVLNVVGLVNSLGKTYFVDDFVEINSLSFVVEKTDFCPMRLSYKIERFHRVDFVNFGLAKMVKRSLGALSDNDESQRAQDKELKIASLGDCHTQLTMYNPNLYNSLTDLFIYFNNDLLKDPLLESIQWFIPKWLGGLGLNPGPKPEERLSSTDIEICGEIFRNYEHYGPKVLTTDVNFNLHNNLMAEIKSLGIESVVAPVNYRYLTHNGYTYDLEEENRNIYNQMKYLWFRETVEEYQEVFENKRKLKELTSNFCSIKVDIKNPIDPSKTDKVNLMDETLRVWFKDFTEVYTDMDEVIDDEGKKTHIHKKNKDININGPMYKSKQLFHHIENYDQTKRLRKIIRDNSIIMKEALFKVKNDKKIRYNNVRNFLTEPQVNYLPIFLIIE
jgi:hypothetical protein